jgi:hypothetical protein
MVGQNGYGHGLGGVVLVDSSAAGLPLDFQRLVYSTVLKQRVANTY